MGKGSSIDRDRMTAKGLDSMDVRVDRIVDLASSGGPAIIIRPLQDPRRYALASGHRKGFAYIEAQRKRLRIETQPTLAESINFTEFDGERRGNWFRGNSVEVIVENGNAEHEANAIRLLRKLALAVQ